MANSRYDDPYAVDVDVNTILAALRYYQEHGQGEPANRSLDIHDIATGNDSQVSMDADGIDGLCEAINTKKIVLVDNIRLPSLDDFTPRCAACGRPEVECSNNPCDAVLADRGESDE